MTTATKKRATKRVQAPAAISTTYMLRTCNADLTSYEGFQWPASGPVECSDWSAVAECGNGLHGLLMGVGDGSLLNWSEDAKWLVVAVDAAAVVAIDSAKVKVPRGDVVYCGERGGAIARLLELGADPALIVCGTATAGWSGTATAGARGTATAGDSGTAQSGTLGVVMLTYWDSIAGRRRIVIGYVGEDGIEANTWYRATDDGKLVKVAS
jgi:hypothetical protein